MINNAANQYVSFQEKKRETVMRKSMKLARANNKVAALRAGRATAFGTPPSGPPSSGGGTPPAPPAGGGVVGTPPLPSPFSGPPSGTPSFSMPHPPSGGGVVPPIGSPPPPGGGPVPPAPPKTKRGVGSTSSPFDLPPLAGSGGDFLTESIKGMADVDNPTPTSVEWKDDPLNPFPEGKFKPFDSSRMFDPTYKPSEEITSPATSRTKKRPAK
jgi:hypothetical protein